MILEVALLDVYRTIEKALVNCEGNPAVQFRRISANLPHLSTDNLNIHISYIFTGSPVP